MIHFAEPTRALKPKTEFVTRIALLYVVILVGMIVAQLFTFDTFIELIISFGLPVSDRVVGVIAPIIVVCELFALPFLLRMTISTAFRWVSLVCGWLVALIWGGITISLVASHSAVESIGLLGTVVDIAPTWVILFLPLLFGVLSVWASWGMWPARRAKN